MRIYGKSFKLDYFFGNDAYYFSIREYASIQSLNRLIIFVNYDTVRSNT